MPQYRMKPFMVEAFQLAKKGSPTPAPDWFPTPRSAEITAKGIILHSHHGDILAEWGDYIVKGIDGDLFACNPKTFKSLYELVK